MAVRSRSQKSAVLRHVGLISLEANWANQRYRLRPSASPSRFPYIPLSQIAWWRVQYTRINFFVNRLHPGLNFPLKATRRPRRFCCRQRLCSNNGDAVRHGKEKPRRKLITTIAASWRLVRTELQRDSSPLVPRLRRAPSVLINSAQICFLEQIRIRWPIRPRKEKEANSLFLPFSSFVVAQPPFLLARTRNGGPFTAKMAKRLIAIDRSIADTWAIDHMTTWNS